MARRIVTGPIQGTIIWCPFVFEDSVSAQPAVAKSEVVIGFNIVVIGWIDNVVQKVVRPIISCGRGTVTIQLCMLPPGGHVLSLQTVVSWCSTQSSLQLGLVVCSRETCKNIIGVSNESVSKVNWTGHSNAVGIS